MFIYYRLYDIEAFRKSHAHWLSGVSDWRKHVSISDVARNAAAYLNILIWQTLSTHPSELAKFYLDLEPSQGKTTF